MTDKVENYLLVEREEANQLDWATALSREARINGEEGRLRWRA